MGPDEKYNGPVTVYKDGQPMETAYSEIPEISLAEEGPMEAVPPAMISGGAMTITLERSREVMKSMGEVWETIRTSLAEAVIVVAKTWEAVRVAAEFKEAMRWASVYNRNLVYRYRNTKKKRIRKKYAKRILAWYREEVL